LDAQIIADDIALSLERFGSLRFKAIAYKALTRIKSAGALGAEIVLAGRLPSERAKMWRFKYGYLRKTGDASNDVNYAESQGVDKQGMVGIKVSILSPETFKNEEVIINDELLKKLKLNASSDEKDSKKKKAKK
jgi:small subunit ribosomal protein S3